jgi:hypothetical protein
MGIKNNTDLAEKINAYWKERGWTINARVEKRLVPIYRDWHIAKVKRDGKIEKEVRIRKHKKPKMIESHEIVSDPPRRLAHER